MNITQTSSSSVSSDPYASGVAQRTTKKALDSADFMKLLAVQFQKQDPMKPMEDTAFIAQMAQFTALQQSSDMAAEISKLRAEQQSLLGGSYLGKAVTFAGGDGQDVTGVVSALENTADGVALRIGANAVALSSIKRIEIAPLDPKS